VLTDLVEAVVDESLLPALPLITRRHLVVVAAVRDPTVEQWATNDQVHATASDAFLRAAAVTDAQRRERASARLRAAGVIVVDALPGELGVRLVDTYLELKAVGRL
jgi:uncharacterized protein (DUF58 family)